MPLLLFILKNPGEVYSLLTEVFGLISAGVDWIDVHNHLATFDVAIKKAQDGKDTSDLEKVFNPKPD